MPVVIARRFAGLQPYEPVWRAMQAFTANRTADTADEIWFMQHEPVYTQGQAGKAEHVLHADTIPVVQTDRGGQVTYHGPGQLMCYTLLDCKRLNLGARALVELLEQVLIAVLDDYGVKAYARRDAPGVYVMRAGQGEAKIAALGLRVKKNGCYHGASLNVDCDLVPFTGINPCGYAGMAVTSLADCATTLPTHMQLQQNIATQLASRLHYGSIEWSEALSV